MIRKLRHTIVSADAFVHKWVFFPLWHLVWPRQCAMCGRVLSMSEDIFCEKCRCTALPKTEEGWHRDNRLECLFAADEYSSSRSLADKFIRGAAYCFYPDGHPIRQAIQLMKFDSKPEIGRELGRMAAEEWKDSGFFDEIDYIIPLPLHKDRYRKRGYNQAEWIAMGIRDVTGLPIDTSHLTRTENNDQQSQKSIEDRRKLGNIFAVKHSEELRGKHVLLVDDVVTSGSTMMRAMNVLHPIPRCRYSVFSLAIAHN